MQPKIESPNLSNLLLSHFQNTSEMILFINREGEVIFMNDAAKRVLSEDNNLQAITSNTICGRCEGFTSEHALKTCYNCFLHSNEMGDSTFQVFMKTPENKVEPFTASYQVIDEDNDIKAFTLQNVTPQLERHEKLHQRHMIQKTIAAQENERKRISRELHDGVVQELINVNVEMRLLKYQQDMESMVSQSQNVEGLMSKLIDDIRNLSSELRPSSLDDLGLDAAFKSYFKQLENNYGLVVNYHFDMPPQRFDSEIETVVYRVVQEAAFNAMKYANVDVIDINIRKDKNRLFAEVSDQGEGFNPKDHPKGSGLGLYGMNERAELVNGKLEIKTEKGKGTMVTLEVPLE
ncbi:sensor histidine kinase [Staphylococcus chromogenes]|uniref:sensor histidine kinase n=1 Tax=Staphylococcus chromogenes TaxID=46126 RepID=UPI000D1BD25B|nr:sensor histidine kinase [Staphylococcus chromogenes]PTF96521.1 two-component sensor histidine kinase [Staphylococcus chromogenes]RIL98609.1 sensor histidine kinase [Staphylococcus chromogenes]